MPFREDEYNKTLAKKMKIGYLCYVDRNGRETYGLESLPISKATERAIKLTREKLTSLGHELVPFVVSYEEFMEIDSCYIAFTRHAIMTGMREL